MRGTAALLLLQACPATVLAQELPAVPTGPGSVMQMMLSLVMVVGVILLLAWAVRRLKVLPSATHAGMNVLAEIPLGPRERAVLLKVGDRQALVGVSPAGVQPLQLLQQDVQLPAVEDTAARSVLAERLRAALGRQS